jgi:hypothetical protein
MTTTTDNAALFLLLETLRGEQKNLYAQLVVSGARMKEVRAAKINYPDNEQAVLDFNEHHVQHKALLKVYNGVLAKLADVRDEVKLIKGQHPKVQKPKLSDEEKELLAEEKERKLEAKRAKRANPKTQTKPKKDKPLYIFPLLTATERTGAQFMRNVFADLSGE